MNGATYSILKKIGKGGSSVVYEVYDKARNLRAIKKVDLSEAEEEEARGYLNEIALLKKLQVNIKPQKKASFLFFSYLLVCFNNTLGSRSHCPNV